MAPRLNDEVSLADAFKKNHGSMVNRFMKTQQRAKKDDSEIISRLKNMKNRRQLSNRKKARKSYSRPRTPVMSRLSGS